MIVGTDAAMRARTNEFTNIHFSYKNPNEINSLLFFIFTFVHICFDI